MSRANIYGNIVSPSDAEKAVAATLAEWLDDYLGEAERLFGYEPNAIQRPRGIVRRSEWEKWPEDQLPVIVIVNAGLASQPIRRATGTYDAVWRIAACPIVSATTEDTTRDLAEAYTVAVRMALLQHKKLRSPVYPNGFADFSLWVDEQYHDMPVLATRSLDSGRVVIDVGVESVATEQAGPRVPTVPASADPGDWPVSTEVQITTIPLSPTEAVK